MTEVPPRPEPRQFDELPRLDAFPISTGPAPPAPTAEELEQWDTLCSVTTTEGLCGEAAVDPEAPLRICAPHLGLAVSLALKRLAEGGPDGH